MRDRLSRKLTGGGLAARRIAFFSQTFNASVERWRAQSSNESKLGEKEHLVYTRVLVFLFFFLSRNKYRTDRYYDSGKQKRVI